MPPPIRFMQNSSSPLHSRDLVETPVPHEVEQLDHLPHAAQYAHRGALQVVSWTSLSELQSWILERDVKTGSSVNS